MEDSLRGLLITLTIIGLFVTAILNFIYLFPLEQGISFSNNNGYVTIQNNTNTQTLNDLTTIQNSSSNSFNSWDVTVGFMGSNQLKQGQGNIISMMTNTGKQITLIATLLFTANSPIVYAIGIIILMGGIYAVYLIIKFIRSGN